MASKTVATTVTAAATKLPELACFYSAAEARRLALQAKKPPLMTGGILEAAVRVGPSRIQRRIAICKAAPPPLPANETVATFLAKLGKPHAEAATKFATWEDLCKNATAKKLFKMGIKISVNRDIIKATRNYINFGIVPFPKRRQLAQTYDPVFLSVEQRDARHAKFQRRDSLAANKAAAAAAATAKEKAVL